MSSSGVTVPDHEVEILKEIILEDEDEVTGTRESTDFVLVPTQNNPHANFMALPIWHYDMRNKVRDVGFFSDAARQVRNFSSQKRR
jgi:hypothetical protein